MPQFSIAIAEIFMLAMLCMILLIDVLLTERTRFVTFLLVQLTLVIAIFLTLPQYKTVVEPIVSFSGNYVLDRISIIAKLFIYISSKFAFAYAL
jgi:NADH-quinone oxidoreductase subunit N